MVAHGDPIIRRATTRGLRARTRALLLWVLGVKTDVDRFGTGALEGWSGIQAIETSSIAVHLDEVGRRAFIDVFSCKAFDADVADRIARSYFGGTGSVESRLR
jgi:hypothetical protein